MSKEKLERRIQPYENEEEAHGHLDRIEAARTEKQVEAMVALAKRFPRNVERCKEDVLRLCRMPEFAEEALYAYPRGGKDVIGPSIRMAEAIIQQWGNMLSGIQEVERGQTSSEVRAYCWELEKNSWAERVFNVPHIRYSKEKGNVALYDPRDIYEAVANQGARRLRAAILSQIPAEFKKEFTDTCIDTLKKAEASKKIDFEKIAKAFAALKPAVTRAELEKYLGHPLAEVTPDEKVELLAMHTALKDGFKKKADFFNGKGGNISPEKEQGSEGKGGGQEAEKTDEEKTDSELRATLAELMAKQGKDKAWLSTFYGVANVKIETVPRSFLEEGIASLRKDALGKGVEIVEEGDVNAQ